MPWEPLLAAYGFGGPLMFQCRCCKGQSRLQGRDNTDSDRVEIGAGTRCITGERLDVLGLFNGDFFDLVSHCEI